MTLAVRINQIARHCFNDQGQLNRYGFVIMGYGIVFNLWFLKWLLLHLLNWIGE